LLGLALSPTHLEDGLFYAYVSTATDNRVVRFPLGGTPNPVFTGIPRGAVHNGGGLLFDADGSLFVGTGDTGDPGLAGDPASLAGKVLEIDVFGAPVGAGPVYSRGHRNVTALCAGGEDALYATDDAPDELHRVTEGGVGSTDPVVSILDEEGGLGGCTAAGRFVFLGALDGERIHVVTLDEAGVAVEEPEEVLGGQYGRLRTVVLDSEGGLWVTTSNRDGIGSPAEDDDKILRILPPSTAGNSPL
jgi:glucose/arabinose dehydrogenase